MSTIVPMLKTWGYTHGKVLDVDPAKKYAHRELERPRRHRRKESTVCENPAEELTVVKKRG